MEHRRTDHRKIITQSRKFQRYGTIRMCGVTRLSRRIRTRSWSMARWATCMKEIWKGTLIDMRNVASTIENTTCTIVGDPSGTDIITTHHRTAAANLPATKLLPIYRDIHQTTIRIFNVIFIIKRMKFFCLHTASQFFFLPFCQRREFSAGKITNFQVFCFVLFLL